ncbi:DUF1819 family protein [Hyphomonas sp.]|uniref:DUF1819 family protein n=1 Tax=Hyphomonas sp. TaxID=87 RepID=UPI003F71F5AD
MAYSSRYRLSFSTGGLFVQESVGAARLALGGCDWDETERLLVDRQIVSYKAISSGKRVAREIVTRLKSLSSEEIEFLVNADREDQICVVWQSICRTYEIIADFVAEDLEERLRSFRNDLAAVDFEAFLDRKAAWHPEVANLNESTRSKLRQVLFRMLREADFFSKTGGLQPAHLSATFLRFLERHRPSDISAFPGAITSQNRKAG